MTRPLDELDRLPLRLLLVLSLLAATAPLSIDFYLASFPAMQDSFEAGATEVQLTLTAFLVGLAVGQVLWGPVADRFGRVRPLVVGSVVTTLAALVCVLAPTIEVLIAARFAQALAGAAGVVICRAIVADRLSGFSAARTMSLLMTIMGIAPILAPAIGGVLARVTSWRVVLGFVLAVSVLQLVGVLSTVRETLPPHRRTPHLRYADIGRVLRRPAYVATVATAMFAFGVLMSYISSSSFVFQNVIGVDSVVYGLAIAVSAVGMTIGGAVSARLARLRFDPAQTVAAALPVTLAGCVVLLALALSPAPPWLLVPPLMVIMSSLGFVTGNCAALALGHVRDVAGVGSAVLGGCTMLGGALVSPLGGVAGEDTAVPMAVVMTCCAALAVGSSTVARRVGRRPATPQDPAPSAASALS